MPSYIPSAARKVSAVTKLPKQERAAAKRHKRPPTKLKAVREVIRDVAGFAPYEKRVLELLKLGRDKRALRFCKRRLGTHSRAKAKREQLNVALRQQRKK
eukprot:TRINITY_DN28233_c0_g1_i1.p2 TRINITY_DN28233_c0_g1~~TRINITY_DN28233_c0_g1_i1.p2  ORF type:complete len:113 (-),score=13.84 TRINITY_DN28233_c0_g1_i1:128-427(-)